MSKIFTFTPLAISGAKLTDVWFIPASSLRLAQDDVLRVSKDGITILLCGNTKTLKMVSKESAKHGYNCAFAADTLLGNEAERKPLSF